MFKDMQVRKSQPRIHKVDMAYYCGMYMVFAFANEVWKDEKEKNKTKEMCYGRKDEFSGIDEIITETRI